MEKAPTFEEVQAFAKSEGLDEKIDVSKFYDYYSRSGFLFKGVPMDWKSKMKEWAKNERPKSQVQMQSAYNSRNKVYWTAEEHRDLLKKIDEEMERWGK